MDQRPLAIAGVLALLLAGGVGFALADGGPQTTQNATVSVSADATVERAPDSATVTVAVVGSGDTAEAARNDLGGDAEAVQQALEAEGATVTSDRFRIRPKYERTPEGREQTGFEAIQIIEADTDDVDSAGTLIDVAVEAGADRVEGVRYELSEETRQSARQEALTTAMERARGDATAIATAAERSVGGVVTAETTNSGRFFVEAEMAAADAGGSGTTLSPGPVTVDVTVQVTYELE